MKFYLIFSSDLYLETYSLLEKLGLQYLIPTRECLFVQTEKDLNKYIEAINNVANCLNKIQWTGDLVENDL